MKINSEETDIGKKLLKILKFALKALLWLTLFYKYEGFFKELTLLTTYTA